MYTRTVLLLVLLSVAVAQWSPTIRASIPPSFSSLPSTSSSPLRTPSSSAALSASRSAYPSSSNTPSSYSYFYSASPSRTPNSPPSMSMSASRSMGGPGSCSGFPIQGLRYGFPLTLFGSTTGAARFGDSCQQTSPTTWYTLNPAPYSNITFTTCNSYTNFDTILTLRAGSCTNMQCLMSNDDACNSKGSTITFSSAPDTTYYISVSGVNGATGNYELIVSTTGSADPTCTEAVYLPGPYFVPLRIAGSNQNSVASALTSCGLQAGDRSVWYHFAPVPGSPMVVSTCSANTNFDTVVSIFQGTCSNTRCVTSNDNNCTTPHGNGLASTVHFTPTSNSYYAVVSGNGGSVGYYQLFMRQEIIPGYSCDSPRSFVSGAPGTSVFTGSTVSTSNLTQSVCTSETGRAYWLHLTVNQDSRLTLATCGGTTNFDTFLSVYSGSCNDLTCVTYNDDNCNGSQSQVTFDLNAKQSVYVVVSGYRGAVGDFTLTLTVEV